MTMLERFRQTYRAMFPHRVDQPIQYSDHQLALFAAIDLELTEHRRELASLRSKMHRLESRGHAA